jgi:hypothetical protein
MWIYNNRADNSEVRFVCGKDYEQMEIHLGGTPLNPQSGIRFIPTHGCFLDSVSGTPAQKWFHLVCVAGQGSGGAKIYVDGVPVGLVQQGWLDGSQALALGSSPFFLGRRISGWSHLDGKLDNVRIYNRALSAGEVATLHAEEKYDGFVLAGAASKAPFDPASASNWSAGGADWNIDFAVSHDGVDSIKAQTTDGQATFRELKVSGPQVVDFWWKVSSEQSADLFSYAIDGVVQEAISGEQDWAYRTLTLGAGEHSIRWTYGKNESGASGLDAGWLDDVALYPAIADLEVKDGATALSGTATVDFGSRGGADLTKTLIFANKGYVPVNVQLSLATDAPFFFREGGGKTYELHLGRGQEVPLELVMDTSVPGVKTTALTITAPDSVTAPPALTLTGTALGGEITVSGPTGAMTHDQNTAVDFGFAPSELVFTVQNDPNAADLSISAVGVTGNFQVTQMAAASVAPGAATTFKVTALDTQPGSQQGTVSITCNDPDTPVFTFPVRSKVMFGTGNTGQSSTATSGSGGAAGWDFAPTTLPGGGSGQALKTGATPNSGASALQGVFEGPGLLSWKWKVATQQGFDWLTCEVNGTEVAGISTKNAAWQPQAVYVPAGAIVQWTYKKDAADSIGEDAGYVTDLAFAKFTGATNSYAQWAVTNGAPAQNATDPKSGMPCVFGWLGGWSMSTGPATNHYRAVREGGIFKYRFPVAKTATGGAKVEFATDLRTNAPTGAWTARGLQQSIYSEDADRAVIEVTAPSQTKGFFRLIYSE